MADPRVLDVQNWYNDKYAPLPGFLSVTADGQTGWNTVNALTRALQYELGITALSDVFGATTLSTLQAYGPIGPEFSFTSPAAEVNYRNLVRIVQAGLYCKGYNGGSLDGDYGAVVTASVKRLREDVGLAPGNGVMDAKLFKALLTMDAYVLTSGGSALIQTIQRDLNSRYLHRQNFFVIPADGHFSRGVQKALLLALQYEIGMTDSVANGNFGPGTQQGLKDQATVQMGSADATKYFVHLFQAAMSFNGYPVPYDGKYGSQSREGVLRFQRFAKLEESGTGNYQTWASLLVSTGDPTRAVQGADCVTTITAARAATLFNSGYRIVGRYLTNTPDNVPNKNIKPGELATIFASGLRVFPIFQTGGATPSHFTAKRGGEVAVEAFDAAQRYGFKRNTTIYFAVDWDALDVDIDTRIIPYFRAVLDKFIERGTFYRVGLYGPRNICARLEASGLTTSSFVSGMSIGYSGNLGFPLPKDWAFDQIATVTIGTGAGQIEIDKNVVSGRNYGENAVDTVAPALDVLYPASVTLDYLTGKLNQWFIDNTSDTQKMEIVRPPRESMQILLDFDTWITEVARQNRMRKSLIQTVLLWEHALTRYSDAAADAAVVATYNYYGLRDAFEANPTGTPPTAPIELKDDSSTGVAQTFSRTAISALNWGTASGYAIETPNADDWRDVYATWLKLHDPQYSIRVASLVLLWGARLVSISTEPLDFNESDIQRTLARYNGYNEAAENYGAKLITLYAILEQINAAARP